VLYELVLVAVHMENFQCTARVPETTLTALLSFSRDQHHETDAAKRKGGYVLSMTWTRIACVALVTYYDSKHEQFPSACPVQEVAFE